MADDTLFAAIQDQKKRRARDIYRGLGAALVSGVAAGTGVPIGSAIATGQGAFALDQTDPRAAEKLDVLRMLVDLQKSADRIKEAEHQGRAESLKAKYEGMDKLIGHFADIFQTAQKGQADVATARAKGLHDHLVELRKQMGSMGVNSLDTEAVRTQAAALKGYYDHIMSQGLDSADLFTDPEQEIPTAVLDMLSSEGSNSMFVAAVVDEADRQIGTDFFKGLAESVSTGQLGDGTRVDFTDQYGAHPERGVAAWHKFASVYKDGDRAITEAQASLAGMGELARSVAEEARKTGVTGGTRSAEQFFEFAQKVGLMADPEAGIAATNAQVAEGGERPAGGLGHYDQPSVEPTTAERELVEYLHSLDQPVNPTSQEAKAAIYASPDFKLFARQRGIEDPDMAWKQLVKEAEAAASDARVRDRARMADLGARPVVDEPVYAVAPEIPDAGAVAPSDAALIAGDPAGSVVDATHDAYGAPIAKGTDPGTVTTSDQLAQRMIQNYRAKTALRLGRPASGE